MIPRPLRTTLRLIRRTGRRRYRLGSVAAVAALAAAAGYGGIEWATEALDVDRPAGDQVLVVSITDGDTFRSTAGPVRIDNIEAPDSRNQPRRCYDPPLAAQATDALTALIPPGTPVELDQTGTSYGRIVALVYLAGVDVGTTLLATHPHLFDPYPHVGGPCPGADR